MPQISRRRALVYLAAVLALLLVGGRFLVARSGSGSPSAGPAAASAALRQEASPPRKLVVHVVGAVYRPGLYRLPDGSRVDDAVRRAGGPKPKADLTLINLAAPIADGQQVVVPTRGSAAASAAGADGQPGIGRVHLNSATLEQLDALPGVGPVTAQKILDYRSAKGAFSSVDELDSVPGIGPARLEQLKPLVEL